MVNGGDRSMFENLNTSHHGALETDDNHLKWCPACWRKAMKWQADDNWLGSSNNRLSNKNPNNWYSNNKDLKQKHHEDPQNSQEYDKEI